jgi:hypothetical protein
LFVLTTFGGTEYTYDYDTLEDATDFLGSMLGASISYLMLHKEMAQAKYSLSNDKGYVYNANTYIGVYGFIKPVKNADFTWETTDYDTKRSREIIKTYLPLCEQDAI